MAPFLPAATLEYKELNKIGELEIWRWAAGGVTAPGGDRHPSSLPLALRMCLFCSALPSQAPQPQMFLREVSL